MIFSLLIVFTYDKAEDLVDYFDSTYVSGPYRQRLTRENCLSLCGSAPTFPIELWNIHETTLDQGHHANNICKRWNNRFSHFVGHNS